MCALSGHLEGDIVWGVALELESGLGKVVEILVEKLGGVSIVGQLEEFNPGFLTSLDALEISEKAGTDMVEMDWESVDDLRELRLCLGDVGTSEGEGC